MTRALVVVLALGLALPSRAEVPPETEGRQVDLKAGDAAPFDGALVDAARARVLLERRRAAELAADQAIALVAERDEQISACESGRGGWQPATVAALVATALAVGVVGGVYLGVQVGR